MEIEGDARPQEGEGRARQVRTLFSEIAPRYDLLNHLLSLNVDRRWRRIAVDRVEPALARARPLVLDACAGTFDLSLELARREGFRGRIVASDFAAPMLVAGKEKIQGVPVLPLCADTQRLPLRDAAFDAAMVAFGVRNLSDIDAGFLELARALRPGGRLVVLEFTTPPNPLLRPLYLFYFHRILPLIGRIVSGHPWAYAYLPKSVRSFPGPEALAERMMEAGFPTVEWGYLTGGIAAIHVGVRG
jgi:demethylmenaquinone methyltransferase / 2-methoxy-6-polyprenyl-1,4-benzoquinol methylase